MTNSLAGVQLIALSCRVCPLDGDLRTVKEWVGECKIPELEQRLREEVKRLRRNGMLRESDVHEIAHTLNDVLQSLAEAESAELDRIERAERASRMDRWIRDRLLDEDY